MERNNLWCKQSQLKDAKTKSIKKAKEAEIVAEMGLGISATLTHVHHHQCPSSLNTQYCPCMPQVTYNYFEILENLEKQMLDDV